MLKQVSLKEQLWLSATHSSISAKWKKVSGLNTSFLYLQVPDDESIILGTTEHGGTIKCYYRIGRRGQENKKEVKQARTGKGRAAVPLSGQDPNIC